VDFLFEIYILAMVMESGVGIIVTHSRAHGILVERVITNAHHERKESPARLALLCRYNGLLVALWEGIRLRT
jgi:hypothetical protein